jgi:hypothetical protein
MMGQGSSVALSARATHACTHDNIENLGTCVCIFWHVLRARASAHLLPLRLSLRGGALAGSPDRAWRGGGGAGAGGAGGAGSGAGVGAGVGGGGGGGGKAVGAKADERKLYPLLLRGLSGLKEQEIKELFEDCGDPACIKFVGSRPGGARGAPPGGVDKGKVMVYFRERAAAQKAHKINGTVHDDSIVRCSILGPVAMSEVVREPAAEGTFIAGWGRAKEGSEASKYFPVVINGVPSVCCLHT